ncbi:hypothetical protein GCM10018785_04150 [Streptomyces longispororuber]|uniref:Uncharacterized protein n=1 Tax=Streptomyces longispororuber TaxID=68230 RepID=A0A918Z5J1_9ACTN|nr:hypothetical protein GCM10018785_04150 [Streptomyces longispororuber]
MIVAVAARVRRGRFPKRAPEAVWVRLWVSVAVSMTRWPPGQAGTGRVPHALSGPYPDRAAALRARPTTPEGRSTPLSSAWRARGTGPVRVRTADGSAPTAPAVSVREGQGQDVAQGVRACLGR